MTWSDEARRESARVRHAHALLDSRFAGRNFFSVKDVMLPAGIRVGTPEFWDWVAKQTPALTKSGKPVAKQHKQLPKEQDYAALSDIDLLNAAVAHEKYVSSLEARFRGHERTHMSAEMRKSARTGHEQLAYAVEEWQASIIAGMDGLSADSAGSWERAHRAFASARRSAGSLDDSELERDVLKLLQRMNAMRKGPLQRRGEPV
jgi:hypothetical protein